MHEVEAIGHLAEEPDRWPKKNALASSGIHANDDQAARAQRGGPLCEERKTEMNNACRKRGELRPGNCKEQSKDYAERYLRQSGQALEPIGNFRFLPRKIDPQNEHCCVVQSIGERNRARDTVLPVNRRRHSGKKEGERESPSHPESQDNCA